MLSVPGKESWRAACKAYLPEEHWSLIQCNNRGGCYLKSGSALLEMYGGKDELFNTICMFQNFPGSHAYFGGGITELITGEETRCYSQAGDVYIYKQDYFRVLQDVILRNKKLAPDNVMAMISWYLRVKEKELKGICELSRYPADKFVDFQRELEREISKPSTTIRLKKEEKNLTELFRIFKEILPENDADPEYEIIHKLLKKHVDVLHVKWRIQFYENWINRVSATIRVLDKFITENPELFRLKTKGPAVVRIFLDPENLVMTHELLAEMRKAGLNYESIEDEILGTPPLSTWNFDTVVEKVGEEEAEKIQFIKTPITKLRNRTVYIPTIDGQYCIPAFEIYIQFLNYIITVKGVFQELDKKDILKVWNLCEDMAATIDEDLNGARFATLEQVAALNADLAQNLQEVIPHIMAKKQSMPYRISNKGFTGKELENELKRFQLDTQFPEILQYSDGVVNRLQARYKTKALRTCDMYDCIKCCITISLYARLEIVRDFLHTHKRCSYLWLECGKCKEEEKAKKESNSGKEAKAKKEPIAEEQPEEESKENSPPSDSSISNITNKMESVSTED